MSNPEIFLQQAIDISIENINRGGGPFGAVVTLNGNVICAEGNSVTIDHDPTAHAEINAIRVAGKILGTHDLKGCVIYCSCEPCPMCLSAIYWSGITEVVYANSKIDAENAGFNDAFIYKEFTLSNDKKKINLTQVKHPSALFAFKKWVEMDDNIRY